MLKFGVFADLHYGRVDVADRMCTRGVEKLNAILGKLCSMNVPFILNMGDLINGDHDRAVNEALLADLNRVMEGRNVINLIGNHDGFHLGKRMFRDVDDDELGAVGTFFADGIKFIILDCNFHADGTPYDGVPGDWKDTICPEKQLIWLKNELETCEKAVICVHHPIVSTSPNPESTHDTHLPLNAPAIRETVDSAGRGKVLCVISGHAHEGGVCFYHGVPHITVPAATTGNSAYCADICINGDTVTYNRHVLALG